MGGVVLGTSTWFEFWEFSWELFVLAVERLDGVESRLLRELCPPLLSVRSRLRPPALVSLRGVL